MTMIVLCAGGHGRVVIEALRSRDIAPAAVADQSSTLVGCTMAGVPVIDEEAVKALGPAETTLANGLGNRATRESSGLVARRELYMRFANNGYRFPAIVHATAIVASDAILEDGAQILAGAIVQPAASVGANAIVNTGVIVEHDCRVGAHAHIAPGAILCGGVVVEAEAHIGAGAIVLQSIRIGHGAVIAAGAVVARDVPESHFFGIGQRGARSA